MPDKRYIVISEFGDAYLILGDIPPEVMSAVEDGVYDIIDITNPDEPLRYLNKKWVAILVLPDYKKN
jgi:hypothetical protein